MLEPVGPGVSGETTEQSDAPAAPLTGREIDHFTDVPLAPGADLSVLDEAKIIGAPSDRALWQVWRQRLAAWRVSAHERLGYDDAAYRDPQTAWASRCWNVAMVWLWDEAVYDWDAGRFDAGRLLDTYEPFGGLDGVVLWHAYPVIGIDDRNQFDWYREAPGLAALVTDLQRRGVRVFLDYNPWDTGTRRAAGSDADEVAGLVRDTGADGVFLDTLKEGESTLRDTLLALDPTPVLEGESRVPSARIGDHLASWAQWMQDTEVPGVLRPRWFEQRHMLHHTRRWNTDHTDELQSAWVNGVGVLVWDVVFGSYVGWSPRDRQTMRAMRRVHLALGDHLLHGTWTPLDDRLAVAATDSSVYGCSWELDGVTLWTLVNRREGAYDGPLVGARGEGGRWFDLVAGTEITGGTDDQVSGSLAARGITALLHVPGGSVAPEQLDELLRTAAADPPVDGTTIERPSDRLVAPAPPPVPGPPLPGAVAVPAGRLELASTSRVRETGLRSAPAYAPGAWKPLPPHLHGDLTGTLVDTTPGVLVDPTEVTNADFAVFLEQSGYRPLVGNRFLAHWVDGRPAPGSDGEPVTFVDLDDARAYAAWRGARLPTEAEWQAAASSPGFRRLEPLVWSWTESEHRDGRTRWAMIKGGSAYAAEGSEWYVDGGPREPTWVTRLLLLGGGLSRGETIGFRCAALS